MRQLALVDTSPIHGLDGSMQKIQILFPDPLMRRLRELAALEDRPLSEVIRRAVERFVEQSPCREALKPDARRLPTFKGGRLLVDSADMKQAIYSCDE